MQTRGELRCKEGVRSVKIVVCEKDLGRSQREAGSGRKRQETLGISESVPSPLMGDENSRALACQPCWPCSDSFLCLLSQPERR